MTVRPRVKKIQVRYDQNRRDRYIVYFDDKRMGEATPLNLHQNASIKREGLNDD